MERSSGILLPLSALPSPHGIGTLGRSAYDFIDFLAASGQRYWQFLPLGPSNCGDSPYSALSSFAGDLKYIDPELLADEGLLFKEELDRVDWGADPARVSYEGMNEKREALLRLAFSRRGAALAREADTFLAANRAWLEPYALYISLKAHFGGLAWMDWPEDIRLRRSEAVARYTAELREELAFHVFVQFLFYRQWTALRGYAKKRGVRFIGDIPIYVALDSADVWSESRYFLLDRAGRPTEVAGVPPDAFSAEGQLWGNPLYDWEAMRADGYGWWIRRIDGARRLYDAIRIDHFRAFESYWAVPAGAETAREGRWRPGPGMDLVGVLTSWFYELQFIAEDLGIITPGVRALLSESGLPGMKVLAFAFDAAGESLYLPHRCEENSVCYVGTHDNDTVLGWLETLSAEDRAFAEAYMHITPDEGWCWGMIRSGMATPSALFMVQMQDLLELDGSCRTNTPGVALGNWRWRMLPDALSPALAEKLLAYTRTFRRV